MKRILVTLIVLIAMAIMMLLPVAIGIMLSSELE